MAASKPEVQSKNGTPAEKAVRQDSGKICEFMTYSGREAFKRMRTNAMLALSAEQKKCYVIGVTSGQVSEGKSTVAINLTYSLAELGKRVLLIDGDLRRPSVHEKLKCDNTPGLTEAILGIDKLRKALRRYTSTTDDTHFDFIVSGSLPDNPSELLNSDRFQRILEAACENYDYVILDLPPVNIVIDAVNAAKYTDGMLIVVRENHCPKRVLIECVEQLRYANANILGFVLNGCVESAVKRYRYNQKYYQYYGSAR